MKVIKRENIENIDFSMKVINFCGSRSMAVLSWGL